MAGKVTKQFKVSLKQDLGDRVTWDDIELDLYSHDMGEFPSIIEKLLRPQAEVVVKVRGVQEIIHLVKLARSRGIPIVPRGSATSGYGGALPSSGGMVIDLTSLNTIREIDPQSETALVDAGVIWKHLETALGKEGFALRVYPSSAPSSTVGGWVAEGGYGIGSYSYGSLESNLESLEVVSPEGNLQEIGGSDLWKYYGAEGITGIITAVRLKVRKAGEEIPLLFSFKGYLGIQSFMRELGTDLDIYHLQILNPQLAKIKNQLDAEDPLPVTYLALVVLENPSPETERHLVRIASRHGGKQLPQKQALHEWEERFNPMRLRKLGPSLIPAEAMIPWEYLSTVFAATEKSIPDMSIEATLTSDGWAILLGFIPSDTRSPAFTLEFAKSLHFLSLVRKRGGKPYGIGLYFAPSFEERWGKTKSEFLRRYRIDHDPSGIMNPGKLLVDEHRPAKVRLLDYFLSFATPLAPLGWRMGWLLPKNIPSLRKKLPQELETAAYTCAQCGYCVQECTLYSGRGWESASPRGKWYYLKRYSQGRLPLNEKMARTFLLCTTCKKCDNVCQTDLPIESLWESMRGELIASGRFKTFPPFEMMGASYDMESNIWASFSENRDSWLPEDIDVLKEGSLGYWAGCTASYVEKDIAQGSVRILKEGGLEFVYLGEKETCCGIPFLMSGKWDLFEKAVRKNIEEIKGRGIKTLIASCPGCWVTLSHHYKQWAEKLGIEWEVEVKHISEVAAELLAENKLQFVNNIPMKITWHDPCHIGRHGGIYEAPREVLKAIPGITLVEMEHNREDALCCGSVLTLIGETKPTSEAIASKRLEEARQTEAQAIVTTCPCCEFQLRVWSQAAGSEMPVRDFASVVSEALGYPLGDPTAEVARNWAVFDKMIRLMTPQGMADFMEEFLLSLPGPSSAIIKGMRALPSPVKRTIVWAMTKVGPSMASRLLPLMLKLMLPRMLPILEQKMPEMSPSMRELMPRMLPGVMERVMPPLLGPMMGELMRA